MTRPLISLVCIIKDEAKSIRSVIETARTAVDRFTILDTGSVDGTQDIIRSLIGPDDLLVEKPFVPFTEIADRRVIDYAATRNMALDLEVTRIDPAVFTLFLSGDEILNDGTKLRETLENYRNTADGAYRIDLRKGTGRSQYPRILRVDAKWRYRFPVHEIPFSPEGHTEGSYIPFGEVVYSRADQARLFKRMKEIDLPVLEYMSNCKLVSHDDHLQRARALLHLALTHENLAAEYAQNDPGSPWISHQMQAMAYYWRRADLEGDPNEKHYALFRYFDIAGKLGFIYTSAELIERLKMLAEMDPARPEVRYMLAVHASQVDLKQGAFFAMEAYRVAREAKDKPLPFATDERVEWLSLQIAAECAKRLEKPERAKKFAEDALLAGAPREHFEEYLA